MPYIDRLGRHCGYLDAEEANATKPQRRYCILDDVTRLFSLYFDNPLNLPDGSEPIHTIQMDYVNYVAAVSKKSKKGFWFLMTTLGLMGEHYYFQASDYKEMMDWVEVLKNECRIKVRTPSKSQTMFNGRPLSESDSNILSSYRTEVIGDVVIRRPLKSQCSISIGGSDSEDELRERLQPTLKTGYCIKQGFKVKSWKHRYFVLTKLSISYYKSKKEKSPLRSLHIGEVIEARVSRGVYPLRENLLEMVTDLRVFYMQPPSRDEMYSWIDAINDAIASYRQTRKVLPSKDRASQTESLSSGVWV